MLNSTTAFLTLYEIVISDWSVIWRNQLRGSHGSHLP